jgi:hypothetical protein
MPVTLTIDQAITRAWHDLQAARKRTERCPSADNLVDEALFEDALNALLDDSQPRRR